MTDKVQEIRNKLIRYPTALRTFDFLLSELDVAKQERDGWKKHADDFLEMYKQEHREKNALKREFDAAKQENERLQVQLDHDYSVYEVTINHRQELLDRLKQAEEGIEQARIELLNAFAGARNIRAFKTLEATISLIHAGKEPNA